MTVPRPAYPCVCCGVRWAHDVGRLCRRCARALGDTTTTQMRDAARQARVDRRVAGIRRVPRPSRICRPVIYEGEAFEVIWEGTCGELSPVTDDLERVTAVMRWW